MSSYIGAGERSYLTSKPNNAPPMVPNAARTRHKSVPWHLIDNIEGDHTVDVCNAIHGEQRTRPDYLKYNRDRDAESRLGGPGRGLYTDARPSAEVTSIPDSCNWPVRHGVTHGREDREEDNLQVLQVSRMEGGARPAWGMDDFKE